MTVYTVLYSDQGCSEYEQFQAADDAEARERADELTEEWIRGGEWGDDGASIEARWYLFACDRETATTPDAEPIADGGITVEIEPDHEALMDRAGAPSDCDHDFISTYDVDGGIRENPGVWGGGGTTIFYRSHCLHCGLRKREVRLGFQRNPGEVDTVEYKMPETADIED